MGNCFGIIGDKSSLTHAFAPVIFNFMNNLMLIKILQKGF